MGICKFLDARHLQLLVHDNFFVHDNFLLHEIFNLKFSKCGSFTLGIYV
jgi:hypothetical protein